MRAGGVAVRPFLGLILGRQYATIGTIFLILVAARAGVSDASVYYHFRDRAGLLQAVFEAGMQPLAYLSTLADEQRDVDEVLADAAEALPVLALR